MQHATAARRPDDGHNTQAPATRGALPVARVDDVHVERVGLDRVGVARRDKDAQIGVGVLVERGAVRQHAHGLRAATLSAERSAASRATRT